LWRPQRLSGVSRTVPPFPFCGADACSGINASCLNTDAYSGTTGGSSCAPLAEGASCEIKGGVEVVTAKCKFGVCGGEVPELGLRDSIFLLSNQVGVCITLRLCNKL